MSTVSRLPEADPLYKRPPAERPAYATGMLLDAQDFQDEQTYHRVQLARALMFCAGGGTLAGLAASHQAAIPDGEPDARPEEIRIAPGIAVDRLGRLIEIPRAACLRVARWFEAEVAKNDGDDLVAAAYTTPERFLSDRAIAAAGEPDAVPIPAHAVVADVFLRFVACPRGLTPSFAAGPFDALNAVSISRVRDAYELQLVLRPGLNDTVTGLPLDPGGAGAATIADSNATPEARRAAVQDAVLGGYPASSGGDGSGKLPAGAEHPLNVDTSAVFIARVLVPVSDDPTVRDGDAVLIDNWSRRFLPTLGLLAQWNGI